MTAPRLLLLLWGVLGALVSVSSAVYRLSPMIVEAIGHPDAGWLHLAVAVPWVGFMAYTEGYRGFQQRFSPMVVARGLHLVAHPKPLHVLLAPIFCIGLFHATPRRLKLSWGVLSAVVVLVMIVRQLPQPWRGVVDAGVVVGLTWGIVATLVFLVRALMGTPPNISAEIPEPAQAAAVS